MREIEISKEPLDTLQNIEVLKNLIDSRGQKIGYEVINFLTTNPDKKKLIMVGGEPGAGKSILAGQIGYASEKLLPNLGTPKHIKYDTILASEQERLGTDDIPETFDFNHTLAQAVLSDNSKLRIFEAPMVGTTIPKDRGITGVKEIIAKTNRDEVDVGVIMIAADPTIQITAAEIRQAVRQADPTYIVEMLQKDFNINLIGYDNSPESGHTIKRIFSKSAEKNHMETIAREIVALTQEWYFKKIDENESTIKKIYLPSGVGEETLATINPDTLTFAKEQIQLSRQANRKSLRKKIGYLMNFTTEELGTIYEDVHSWVAINPKSPTILHLIKSEN